LLATKENKLDALPVERIEKLKAGLGDWLTNMSPAIKAKLEDSGTLDATEREALLSSLDTYISRLGGPLHSEA
ncbi:MAG: hypothetical protein KDJ17_08685, partial [Hyphomicrobiaceae bacterium]|nr:hypothetical protein [Hyphomicrobiaceae bacterium]